MTFRLGLGLTVSILSSQILLSQDRLCKSTNLEEKYVASNSRIKAGEDQVVFIPVVFHVVYSNENQNVSSAQLYSQLNVLNQDYNRKNADTVNTIDVFKPFAANCNIRFFFAQEDPLGNPTNGITRTQTNHGPFANDDIHFLETGGVTAWETGKYLNIWVCDLSDGVFGYASSPGSPIETDGVVIDFQYLGTKGTVSSPYNKGRTATHEIGHWLGLQHIWGVTGACEDDDGIEDTPRQSGPTTGCDLTKESCGALNMVQNFMDNSYDDCMNFFTTGQKDVMRNTLFGVRSSVILEDVVVTGTTEDMKYGVEIFMNGMNSLTIKGKQPIRQVETVDQLGRKIPADIVRINDSEWTVFVQERGLFVLLVKSGSFTIARRILFH